MKILNIIRIMLILIASAAVSFFMLSLHSCATANKITPINSIETERYLGIWYEIARMDFFFERNLNKTTAEYRSNEKNYIEVINRGYNYKTNKWEKAEGKARFRSDKTNGELKVSFFGPFYGEYNIIKLDNDYKYALIAGKNTKYLWILSREKTIPDEIKEKYLQTAQKAGYDTDKLIWVQQ